eukprot:XP_001691343.1 predicted protein [Chlamydomonas reinhardtii]
MQQTGRWALAGYCLASAGLSCTRGDQVRISGVACRWGSETQVRLAAKGWEGGFCQRVSQLGTFRPEDHMTLAFILAGSQSMKKLCLVSCSAPHCACISGRHAQWQSCPQGPTHHLLLQTLLNLQPQHISLNSSPEPASATSDVWFTLARISLSRTIPKTSPRCAQPSCARPYPNLFIAQGHGEDLVTPFITQGILK